MILPSHRRMLEIIRSNPELKRVELAGLYGASNGSHTIAANLNFLKKKGLVNCDIKKGKRYTVTMKGRDILYLLDDIDAIMEGPEADE